MKKSNLPTNIFGALFLAGLIYSLYSSYGIVSGFFDIFINPKPNLILFFSTYIFGVAICCSLFLNFRSRSELLIREPHALRARIFFFSYIAFFAILFLSDSDQLLSLASIPLMIAIGLHFYLILGKKYFFHRRQLSRQQELASLLLLPLFFLNGSSGLLSLSKSDRELNYEIAKINQKTIEVTVAEKINLCDQLMQKYIELIKIKKEQIEKSCVASIVRAYNQNPEQPVDIAFKWVYAQYVKKPTTRNSTALACFYAEMNQVNYALSVASKNKLTKVEDELKNGSRCKLMIKRKPLISGHM